MDDVNCPYCGEGNEINHDDGFGYSENEIHQMDCYNCDKIFGFETSINFLYEERKLDCANGETLHDWEPTFTIPVEATRMACRNCGENRKPTSLEWEKINSEKQS